MSGKAHSIIGVTTVSAFLIVSLLIGINRFTLSESLFMVLGSLIGSLIVDIDCKRSKATQAFNKALTYTILGFICLICLNKLFGFKINILINFTPNITLILFGIVTVLGKMSPHRQFTHKVLGTCTFILLSYFSFPLYFTIGFSVGYILHIIADKTTSNGLNFLDFKLPLQDREGNLKYHF